MSSQPLYTPDLLERAKQVKVVFLETQLYDYKVKIMVILYQNTKNI